MKLRIVIPAMVMLALLGACNKAEGDGVATAGGQSAAQASADPARPADDPRERGLQFVACLRAE
ncbi:MAG TPA: hypothetical protein VF062_26810, partial [Candidatus Limnocylindrales bacterium]